MAQHAYVLPPESRTGPLEDAERAEIIQKSILNSKYENMIDSVSAYEVITGKTPQAPAGASAGGGYTYSADFNTPVQAAPQTGEAAYDVQVDQGAVSAEAAPAADGEISFDIEMEVAKQHEELNSRFPQEEAESKASKKGSSKAAKVDAEEEEGGRSLGDMADSFLGKSGTRQVMRSTGGSIGREIGKTIGEAVLGKKGRTIGGNIGSAIGRNLFGTLTKRK
jgi:hypothetical protein